MIPVSVISKVIIHQIKFAVQTAQAPALRLARLIDVLLSVVQPLAAFLAIMVTITLSSAVLAKDDITGGDTRDVKIKNICRREPRDGDLIRQVEKIIAAGGADEDQRSILRRRSEFLEHFIMSAGNLSADRLHDYTDILETLTTPVKKLAASDLSQLQERYQKLCDNLNELILIKDLESVVRLHDRCIRLAALGALDKDQISDYFKRIEQAAESAPTIPYGRAELLRSLQDKKLMPPVKGCYVGTCSGEEIYLSTDRDSVGILEESAGTSIQLDYARLIIQGPQGKLYDLNSANHPSRDLPFSPPLLLWMKSRLMEGRIPAIQFELTGRSFPDPRHDLCVQDILDGKLDQYFAKNLKLIASTSAPILVGLFGEFDRAPAATAFGADGRTPYYLLLDPKLSRLSPEKLAEELPHRLSKGSFTKDIGAELSKYYGDPNVPDGPERVRDSWKHLRKLIAESGATFVSFYSCAGAFHGNKKGLAYSNCAQAGAQDWNKLDYYYPGEGTLNWIGSVACGNDVSEKVDAFGPVGSINHFMQEVLNGNFRTTPVLLQDLGPSQPLSSNEESIWISKCFQELIPATYSNVKAFLLSFPQQVTLHSPDPFATFRRAVASTSYYKQPLNLKTD